MYTEEELLEMEHTDLVDLFLDLQSEFEDDDEDDEGEQLLG